MPSAVDVAKRLLVTLIKYLAGVYSETRRGMEKEEEGDGREEVEA